MLPIEGEELNSMARLTPDPTFYPSADMAMAAPAETLAYVAAIGVPTNGNGHVKPDALLTLDVDPTSSSYGQTIGRVDMLANCCSKRNDFRLIWALFCI